MVFSIIHHSHLVKYSYSVSHTNLSCRWTVGGLGRTYCLVHDIVRDMWTASMHPVIFPGAFTRCDMLCSKEYTQCWFYENMLIDFIVLLMCCTILLFYTSCTSPDIFCLLQPGAAPPLLPLSHEHESGRFTMVRGDSRCACQAHDCWSVIDTDPQITTVSDMLYSLALTHCDFRHRT